MTEIQIVGSSLISYIKYSNGLLLVEFTNGSKYVYSGVTQTIIDKWLESDSYGRYFLNNIKDRYNYIRI